MVLQLRSILFVVSEQIYSLLRFFSSRASVFVFVCAVGHEEFRDLNRFVAVNLLSLLKSYVSRMEDDINVNAKPYKVSKYQIDNIVIDSNLNCHSYSLHSLANCMPIAFCLPIFNKLYANCL